MNNNIYLLLKILNYYLKYLMNDNFFALISAIKFYSRLLLKIYRERELVEHWQWYWYCNKFR